MWQRSHRAGPRAGADGFARIAARDARDIVAIMKVTMVECNACGAVMREDRADRPVPVETRAYFTFDGADLCAACAKRLTVYEYLALVRERKVTRREGEGNR